MMGALVSGAAAMRDGDGAVAAATERCGTVQSSRGDSWLRAVALARLRRCGAVSQLLLQCSTPVLFSGNY